MTDFIPTEPGPAAPFGLLNELLSLRAELAEAKESLRLSAQGLHTYVEALNAGNAALAAKDARIAALENKNSYNLQIVREDRKRAEAALDISREAHRMVQSALLSQAAETERAETERDAMREALRKIEQETIDHVAVRIARAALAPSLAGREG